MFIEIEVIEIARYKDGGTIKFADIEGKDVDQPRNLAKTVTVE